MAEITLKINNRGYGLFCDEGQEERLTELASYVDSRLKDIAAAGAASNEAHLLVLTSLVMADEVFDMREELSALKAQMQDSQNAPAARSPRSEEEEVMIARAIEQLAGRVEHIASRIHIDDTAESKVA